MMDKVKRILGLGSRKTGNKLVISVEPRFEIFARLRLAARFACGSRSSLGPGSPQGAARKKSSVAVTLFPAEGHFPCRKQNIPFPGRPELAQATSGLPVSGQARGSGWPLNPNAARL